MKNNIMSVSQRRERVRALAGDRIADSMPDEGFPIINAIFDTVDNHPLFDPANGLIDYSSSAIDERKSLNMFCDMISKSHLFDKWGDHGTGGFAHPRKNMQQQVPLNRKEARRMRRMSRKGATKR